jgi:Flp pilus assembly protein TadG
MLNSPRLAFARFEPAQASIMRDFVSLIDRFRRDQRGNIAVIFAIALLPLLTFVGAAIDYSRANNARSSMQAAMDSATLMVSKDLSQGLITTAQINTKAQAYFTALYTNKEAQSVSVNATYTPGSGNTGPTVQLSGSANIATDFMNVIGFPHMGFGANSTSTWGSNLLRIALVLDNTGSMTAYNKIGALQTAAKNLVTQLSALAKTNGDVYISVVPFAIDVNVGTSNVGASWLRWDLWDPSIQTSNCTGGTNAGFMSYATCLGHNYAWHHTVGTPAHSQWGGCVTDRDSPNDVNSTAPSSLATNFIADQDPLCPATQVLPLTYSWSTINTTIDAMTAQGATNQTIGLQWGWLSLLQQAPLNAPAESTAPGVTYQHIIILFTDGLNTGDRWNGDLSNTSSQVDTKMATLCSNAKASGVTIYTVQIDTDGAGQSAVLPACASGPGNFFMLTSPSQIAAAFAQIGASIAKLRIAM